MAKSKSSEVREYSHYRDLNDEFVEFLQRRRDVSFL